MGFGRQVMAVAVVAGLMLGPGRAFSASYAPDPETEFDIRSDLAPLITVPPSLYVFWADKRPHYSLSFPWSVRFGPERDGVRPHRLLIEPGVALTKGDSTWFRLGYRLYLPAGDRRFGLLIGHGVRVLYLAGTPSYSPELLFQSRSQNLPGAFVLGVRGDVTGLRRATLGLIVSYSYW